MHLLTGDINADFARETSHTNLVSEELLDLGLSRSWDDYDVDFTCCHDIAGVSHTSILDHFFWNKGLGDAVRDAGVVHHPDDHSDHCPIFCVLSLDSIVHDVKESSQKQLQKPSWIRASQEERQIYKLHKLTIPESVLECKDVKCRRADHLRDLDMFAMDLLETLQVVAEASLPTPSTRKSRKVIPGWNQVVKPFKDKAYFWHQIWASMGRPINCEIHRVMKSSRNRYHYELKKCRKAEDKVRSSKLLEACLNGDCDIFKQIKTMRTTQTVVATSIDGVKDNVKDHFRDKYKKLFNSTNDGNEILRVQEDIDSKVIEQNLSDVEKVTPEIVKKATKKLKSGKVTQYSPFHQIVLKMHQIFYSPTSAIFFRDFFSMDM